MVDTHCHLNILLRNFSQTLPISAFSTKELAEGHKILNEAKQNDVNTIINVGTNYIESLLCIQLAQDFSNCFATVGIHPNDTDESWQEALAAFDLLLATKKTNKIVGIGECGIDKHYPNFDLKLQYDVFHAQIQLALKHKIALSIHSRDADQETYEILAEYRGQKNFKGVIHCFSSDEIYAQKYIDLGFVLGFGGTVTYPKNETLRNVARMIPLEKIVLETDAPFLPPQDLRGKKNVPANIAIIAQYLAELKNTDLQTVATVTTQNCKKLFEI